MVDTSVARAAGQGRPDAGVPAPQCVAALEAIRSGTSVVVMSKELKDEWQRHARDFATRWLASMRARKRFEPKVPEWAGEIPLLDAAADLPGEGATEVAQDAHLVSLAMVTDRRVLSLDRRQRSLLARITNNVPALSELHWASPTDGDVLPWLADDLPDHPPFRVGPPRPEDLRTP